jgi:hypothetical protein
VSSTVLSLLSVNQINVVIELHHSLTNTTHPFPSPIAPGNLAGDPTTSLWTGHPERPPAKCAPTSVIPYLRPCLATTPSAQNRATDEETPRNFTDGRFSPPRTALSPPRRRYPPPPFGVWARAHGVSLRRSSLPWAG